VHPQQQAGSDSTSVTPLHTPPRPPPTQTRNPPV